MLHSLVTSSDLEGRILGGCRLLGRLSTGAMGDVYLAEQLSLGNRLVAVKVVPARVATDGDTTVPAAEARFMHEAQVLARFAHPNILTIHDSGVTDDLLYLVMQYVPDGSLGDVIRGKGHLHLALPVAAEQADGMIRQIASALQYTHDRGMVHRDVKPSNVLVQVQPDGGWHLLLADFGIARNMESTANLHRVTGTIAYMAPEQLTGRFSPASDQYSLGVLAYVLLAGRTPFVGGAVEVMNAHQVAPVPEIQRFNSEVSPALSAVVARALAKHPEERWPSVMAFSQALSQAASGRPDSAATRTADALAPAAGVAPLAVAALEPLAPGVVAAATEPSAPDAATMLTEPVPLAPSEVPTRPLPVYTGGYSRVKRRRRLLAVLVAALLLLAGLTLLAQRGMLAGGAGNAPSRSTPTSQPTRGGAVPTGNAGGALAPGAGPAASPTARATSRPGSGSAAPATPRPQATRPVAAPTIAPTAAPTATATVAPTATATAQPSATPAPATPAPTSPTTAPGAQSGAPAAATSSTSSTDAARLAASPSQVGTRPGKTVEVHLTLTNTGSSTWSGAGGYALACDTASHPTASCAGNQPVSLGARTVAPGQTLAVVVRVTAPRTSGTYQIWWNLTHNGVFFTTPDGHVQVTVTG